MLNKMMHCRITSILFVGSLIITLSGCAEKRWSDPLLEEESFTILQSIIAMQDKHKQCPQNLDADALVFWKSPMTDSAISGYLQLQSPSKAKFIVSNPLGMLAYAFTSDGNTFQILDTGNRRHITGNLRKIATRKGIPVSLIQSDWFAILNSRLPAHSNKFEKISRDITNQTVWVLLPQFKNKSLIEDEQWVNIDIIKEKLLGYLFLDKEGNTVAEISYTNKREEQNSCYATPQTIHISNLPWGTEIKIELHDVRTDSQFTDTDFSLPVPEGYFKQLQP